MNHWSTSRGLPDLSREIEPDKRWIGTLLCCVSALITTVIVILVASFLTSADGRDIARGDGPGIENVAPADRGVSD